MKKIVEKTKKELDVLSKEELQSIVGGAYWEVKIVNGHMYYIFHAK